MSTLSRPTDLRPRRRGTLGPRAWRSELTWIVLVALPAAVVLGYLITVSLRAAVSLVLVVMVAGLYQHDRRMGVAALFGFWCLVPELRRGLDVFLGYAGSDPLSVAPFVATAVLAGLELYRTPLPPTVRRVLLTASLGFLIGFPLGIFHPKSGLYATVAYLAGLSAAVLGFRESTRLTENTLRRILIVGVPLIALYAVVAQRALSLPSWEQSWLNAVTFNSIGADSSGHVRLFGTLNAPGTLAPLLGVALLTYITVRTPRGRMRYLALAAAVILAVALELTFVRSSWLALPVAAIAHMIASRGASTRLVLTVAGFVAALTLALAPVSPTARDVVNRASTFSSLSNDTSANARSSTLSSSLPTAVRAPIGHGLGTAGQPSQLNTAQADLAIPDDGYLALMYQVGPVGFMLVIGALIFMMHAAWTVARGPTEARELGALLFSSLVFMAVVLTSGDAFYGLGGLTLWYLGGNALALRYGRPRAAQRRALS